MNIVLALMPWSLIRKIVMAILEMVVESTDNDVDDTILDIVSGVIDDAEIDEPDVENKDSVIDFISDIFSSDEG